MFKILSKMLVIVIEINTDFTNNLRTEQEKQLDKTDKVNNSGSEEDCKQFYENPLDSNPNESWYPFKNKIKVLTT